jgi:cation-transporting P-type ATPase I
MSIAVSAARFVGTATGHSFRLAAMSADAMLSVAEHAVREADHAAEAVRDAASAVADRIGESTAAGNAAGGAPADSGHRAWQVATTAAAVLADAGPDRSRRHIWRRAGHAHIEVRGLAGSAGHDIAKNTAAAVRRVKGVRWARINAITQQILVAFDEDETDLNAVLDEIEAVEAEHGADDDTFPQSKPEMPGDPSAEDVALAALASSLAGAGLATAGRIMRIPGLPRAVRLPVVIVQSNPRVRAAVEARLGRLPSSLAFGLASAAVHASTVDPYPLVVESAQRALAVLEARSRRLAWERRAHQLSAQLPETAPPRRPGRPVPLPPGPVEKAADRVSLGGLAAVGGTLAMSRDPGRATDLLLATAPKAARMGREAFASALGHELSRQGILTLNMSALRRLDRVSAVVIDSSVLLIGDQPDPLADALVGAARDCAQRILLTDQSAAADLLPWADKVVPAGADLSEQVRALQTAGHGVLVISAADDAALGAADVGVALVRDGHVGWSADILGGSSLEDAWRLLKSVELARSVSDRSAKLAVGGASLGALLVVTDRSTGTELSPGNSAAGLTVVAGAASARALGRLPRPQPVPHGRWHEMTAQEVCERLRQPAGAAARPEPEHAAPGRPASLATFGHALSDELRDPLMPVLALGAGASAILGSGVDAALVGGVMTGNALVGAAQKVSAERALGSLLFSERLEARRVTGDGSVQPVPAEQLAPGDVIGLRPSDVVPADARLLESDRMEVDQATITGESLPVPKSPEPTPGAELADRSCMLYQGTTVLTGEGRAVVVAVGQATEAGRAAAAAAGSGGRAVGVQAHLAELTRISIPATGIGGTIVTGLSLARRVPFLQALASGIAIAVAAVPEGLPLVATVSQVAAARRLSRLGVLVRSPRTLEALGRVDTFCFDKTGTLTEGRLAVTRLAGLGGSRRDLPFDDRYAQRLLRAAARSCPQDDDTLSHATDLAIVETAREHLKPDPDWNPVQELAFEASRGYSASLGKTSRGMVLAMKGAPEVVLDRCATDDGGRPLTEQRRRAVVRRVQSLAGEGLRVIAVAEKRLPGRPGPDGADEDIDALARDLILLGFVGIADAVRPQAAETIRRLNEAGVRVTMITGDHPVTAGAIARQLGIPGSDTVLTGSELEAMPDGERTERVPRTAVFARVSPEQKVRVVQALQRAGRVVAMTGDGVNDAAAIRLADVGIGVSARGSASARSAASLVLTDPDPARLVDMLAEGRALWSRVRDAVAILVGGNAGEVAFTVFGTAAGGRAPLNTRQLLLVNMFTDMLPSLAVALGPVGSNGAPADTVDLSTGPASLSREELARNIGVRGAATAAGAGAAWLASRAGGRNYAGTTGLGALVMTELGQTLVSGWRSPLVVITCAASAAALVAVVEMPGVSQFFGCTPLGPAAWTIVAASSAAATIGAAATPDLVRAIAQRAEDIAQRAGKRPDLASSLAGE